MKFPESLFTLIKIQINITGDKNCSRIFSAQENRTGPLPFHYSKIHQVSADSHYVGEGLSVYVQLGSQDYKSGKPKPQDEKQ